MRRRSRSPQSPSGPEPHAPCRWSRRRGIRQRRRNSLPLSNPCRKISRRRKTSARLCGQRQTLARQVPDRRPRPWRVSASSRSHHPRIVSPQSVPPSHRSSRSSGLPRSFRFLAENRSIVRRIHPLRSERRASLSTISLPRRASKSRLRNPTARRLFARHAALLFPLGQRAR